MITQPATEKNEKMELRIPGARSLKSWQVPAKGNHQDTEGGGRNLLLSLKIFGEGEREQDSYKGVGVNTSLCLHTKFKFVREEALVSHCQVTAVFIFILLH